jgi:hypothetical protein
VALIDDATLVIGAGNYFIADTPGAALPVDLTAPAAPWENVGHPSLEDIFALSSEGGEATVIGTLQKRSLRTIYSDRVETLTFTLQQFDEASLKLFLGSNAPTVVDGSHTLIGNPMTPTPAVKAFLAVFIDGANVFAFYAPRAEIYRADDLAASDTENFVGLPLAVTPLQQGTNPYTYAITPLAAA